MPADRSSITRSGEVNMLQEAVSVAVQNALLTREVNAQAHTELIRNELATLRTDIKGEFSAIHEDLSGINKQLADGDKKFALIDQQFAFEKQLRQNDRDRDQNRNRFAPPVDSTTRLQTALDKKRSDKPLIKVSPKVFNSVILAIAAAAGGTAWHYIEHTFFPSEHHVERHAAEAASDLAVPEPKK